MLTAQAAMLATLDTEPSCPTRGIPHIGLTPTGADSGSEEGGCRVPGDRSSSYKNEKKTNKQQ
jgi:hypothetical protein